MLHELCGEGEGDTGESGVLVGGKKEAIKLTIIKEQ